MNARAPRFCLAFALLLASTAGAGRAAAETTFPGKPFGLEVAWKKALGSGYSEVAAAGGLLVTMFSDAEHDLVAALDAATGAERWRYQIGPVYKGHDGSDDGPAGSPVVHDGAVYGLDPHGRLFAVRLTDGKEIWARSLDTEKEATLPRYGFATTPLVAGDSLIVLTGRESGGAISAYDRRDGKPLWSRGDDSVAYQSPVLTTVAGAQQVVAATNHLLLGLDPKDGSIVWQHRHTPENGEGIARPVAMGDDRFVVVLGDGTAAFQVARSGEGFGVSELWRVREFQNTYAMPVYREGHLYGLTGRFLTCVEAATGKVVWKSRPPGGHALTLVGDHLAVLATGGEVVLVEATPTGYVEKARGKALEREALTAPTYAGGRFFVRDLKEISSLRVTAAAAPAPAKASGIDRSKIGGELGALLAQIEAAPAEAKPKLVADFFAARPGGPIVEDNGRVHFTYRGEAKDVGVSGSVLDGFDQEVPLERVPGTDLHLRTLELDPAGCYDYRLRIDFGELGLDPANPLKVGAPPFSGSELRMSRWPVPAHLAEPPAGQPRGKVEQIELPNAATKRRMWVYLPAGYDSGTSRYPLLLLNNTDAQLTGGNMANSLDNLTGSTIQPVIVAFLERMGPDGQAAGVAAYAKMVAEEVVPFLDGKYRTDARPEARVIGGINRGAFVAAYTAYHHPQVFGGLALQSFFLLESDQDGLPAKVAATSGGPRRVYLESNAQELLFPTVPIDVKKDTARFEEALRAKGVELIRRETPGKFGWCTWRASTGKLLEAFFKKG